MDPEQLEIGKTYHTPSYLGGAFRVKYLGLDKDLFYLFQYVDWLSKELYPNPVAYNRPQVVSLKLEKIP